MRWLWVFVGLLALAVAPPRAQAATAALSGGATEPAEQAQPATPIPLRSPDQDIRRRLLQLYGAIDGLAQVRVQVRAGVVALSGTVLDVAARDQAEQVATRLSGGGFGRERSRGRTQRRAAAGAADRQDRRRW